MTTTSGWTARIGEDAARLRLAYVASWAESVLAGGWRRFEVLGSPSAD